MKLVACSLFILLLFTLPFKLFAQSGKKNCKSDWQFFKLKKSITGTVILHEKAGPCGLISFSSCTILKTSAGDTIRVLELCDEKKVFAPGDHVKINTVKYKDYGIVTTNKYECIIKKTTVGVVTKVE
ncbi:MAG TPA: hypothetical protein VIM89_09695 [Mucilaginibacter sp.]